MVEVRQPTNFFNDARDTRTICILMTIFSKQVEKFRIEADNEFFGIFRTLHPAGGEDIGLRRLEDYILMSEFTPETLNIQCLFSLLILMGTLEIV